VTIERLQLVLQYYRFSIGFLLLSSVFALIFFAGQIFGSYPFYEWSIALVHLGTLGALTIGLMGLYQRVYFPLEEIRFQAWPLQTILIVLSLSVLLIFAGMGIQTWLLLGPGVLGVSISLLWWSIQYYRWFFQASREKRAGVLLFGALGVLGLVAALILGDYLLHSYMTASVVQNFRLSHIHAGLVGWASLSLLGLGVALRGEESPVMGSVGTLRGSAWLWFVGMVFLIVLFAIWRLNLILMAAGIILLGFLGYGYSMPKVDTPTASGGDSETATAGRRLLPFIIVGFAALFLTILLGFDITANYPSGRATPHRMLGVGGWLLMTYLMTMLSEVPKTLRQLSQSNVDETSTFTQPTMNAGIIRVGWIALTGSLVLALIGSFVSPKLLYAGSFLLALVTLVFIGYLAVRFRIYKKRT